MRRILTALVLAFSPVGCHRSGITMPCSVCVLSHPLLTESIPQHRMVLNCLSSRYRIYFLSNVSFRITGWQFSRTQDTELNTFGRNSGPSQVHHLLHLACCLTVLQSEGLQSVSSFVHRRASSSLCLVLLQNAKNPVIVRNTLLSDSSRCTASSREISWLKNDARVREL